MGRASDRDIIPMDDRLAVFEGQNWRCCYCGVHMWMPLPYECPIAYAQRYGLRYFDRRRFRTAVEMQDRRATIEHIRPRSKGGDNHIDNLVGACGWCNSNRGDLTADDWFYRVESMVRHGQFY